MACDVRPLLHNLTTASKHLPSNDLALRNITLAIMVVHNVRPVAADATLCQQQVPAFYLTRTNRAVERAPHSSILILLSDP
jgi:hypothetical protein